MNGHAAVSHGPTHTLATSAGINGIGSLHALTTWRLGPVYRA